MQPLSCSFPTLALSVIYCLYHAYQLGCLRRERTLRERVAYMLWVMAGVDGGRPNAA